MLHLYHKIKENNFIDPLYIWKKMKEEQIYVFTATPLSFTDDNPSSNTNTLPTEVINTDTLVRNMKICFIL